MENAAPVMAGVVGLRKGFKIAGGRVVGLVTPSTQLHGPRPPATKH